MNILSVEDDRYFAKLLQSKLAQFGEVDLCSSAKKACELLKKRDYQLVVVDLDLTDGDLKGLEVIRAATEVGSVPVVLSSHLDSEAVALAYEAGCFNYFSKSDFLQDQEKTLGPFLRSLKEKNLEDLFEQTLLTNHHLYKEQVRLLIRRLEQKNHPFLITGGRGCGKSFLAREIFRILAKETPIIREVSLSQKSPDEIEDLLFGTSGLFQESSSLKAQNLLVKECSLLPSGTQKRILKFLQQNPHHRVVFTTRENLIHQVSDGKLRIDLYDFISTHHVTIPPLEERKEDIFLQINSFLKEQKRPLHFTQEAMEALENYGWYGNTQELIDFLNNTFPPSGAEIGPEDLPKHIRRDSNPLQEAPESKLYTKAIAQFIEKHGLKKYIEIIEKEAFKDFYMRHEGHFTNTLEQLGISRSVCYRIQKAVNDERQGKKLYS